MNHDFLLKSCNVKFNVTLEIYEMNYGDISQTREIGY